MRPNLFANTPDILHEYLQRGGRPAFQVRLVLAATLGASYGIYSGFELVENVPVRPGSEEYLDSEKYQIRRGTSSSPAASPTHRARQRDPPRPPGAAARLGPAFHDTDNAAAHLLQQAARRRSRSHPGRRQPRSRQHAARLRAVAARRLELAPTRPSRSYDLLSGERYFWRGERNYVRLDPQHRRRAHPRCVDGCIRDR